MVRVMSRVVGCEVGLVEDEAERLACREAGERMVLYSRDEVERMRGLPTEDVQAIHDLKRHFGGVYEGPGDPWPERETPEQEELFDLSTPRLEYAPAKPVAFPGEWGDEVTTPEGAGVVVNIWDNDYDASHVTVALDGGERVVFPASEVTPCAV